MKRERTQTNRRSRKREQRVIFWLVGIVLIAVLAIMTVWFWNSSTRFSPEAATYRYCMGNKIEYDEELALVYTDASTTIEEESKVTSDGTPLLYEGECKMVIPVSMGYMRPFEKEESVLRVNYFSVLSREKNYVNIFHDGVNTEASGGFLYDADGTYIFLEEMEIQVGESTYRVQPLAYAKEIYRDSVEIYDVSTGEYQYIAIPDTDAVAVSDAGYSVNLGTGVMTTGDANRILFGDIEAMGVLK